MFKTAVCDLFGIKYPILQGGMVWVSYHELCAAVSESGGMGFLAGGCMTGDELREQIRLVKAKTEKPFGLNVPIVFPHSEDLVNVAIKEGVSVIATSAGSPKHFTQKIHDAGLKVIHVSPSPVLAIKAAEAGVDAIIAEGTEAGGHDGFDEITTMALVPLIVKAVDIPVIAAGGIANGNGFVAAMALGAQGVQIGTRFAATHEAKGHPNFKNAILNVRNTGTVITGRAMGPTRCVRNKLTEMILEAEARGATAKELFELIGTGRSRSAAENGEVEEGTVYCGQIAGIIDELKSVNEVITGIMEDATTIVKKLSKILP
ncbi:MAG: nitronate monooxygenase [Desulfosporosinus sp.]